MKISYAITVCNEFVEIQRLVNFLVKNKRPKDEIVILYDEGNGDPEIEEYLRAKSINGEFIWYKDKFNNHFADWKNKLASFCSGDYIYQLDADEMISEYAIDNLPMVLQYNSVDVVQVPRVNTVQGLTQQHIDKWGWRVNDKGWVNFPDYQWRIYKNNGDIKWKNKLASFCSGDYIYQIDADEMVSSYVLDNLPEVLQHNNVDVLQVPRINTVKGLNAQHIDKWGWRINDKGWVNFPDYQWRIYKNNNDIKWKNKVHEILEGYKTMSYLPAEEEWCLSHPKTIKKQEKQNKYYETL